MYYTSANCLPKKWKGDYCKRFDIVYKLPYLFTYFLISLVFVMLMRNLFILGQPQIRIPTWPAARDGSLQVQRWRNCTGNKTLIKIAPIRFRRMETSLYELS